MSRRRKKMTVAHGVTTSFAEPRRTMSEEIATRKTAYDFFGLNMFLPNPDPVLKSQGKDIAVYRDLQIDDRVGGNLGRRKAGVLQLQWDLDHGRAIASRSRLNKTIFSTITGLFGSLDINRIITEILDAVTYGYQPMEILQQKTASGLILPLDIVGKPPEWFQFDTDNGLRFKSKAEPIYGEELPPYSFLCPTSGASYFNPYGQAIMSRCFWPVTFKKGGWRFWITFAEKYGQPFAVGKIRRGANKADMDDLADKLQAMVQDAIAVIYDDSSVELLTDDNKGASTELFRGIIAEANSAISTVILGHAGAGESVSGKLGGETAATEAAKDVIDADRRIVNAAMNHLIAIINQLNWQAPPEELPQFGLWEEEDVDTKQAERDKALSGPLAASGLALTADYYKRAYDLEDGDLTTTQPAQSAQPAAAPAAFAGHVCPHCSTAFAEGELQADQVDQAVQKALDQADGSAMVEQIRQVIAGSGSLADAARQLDSYKTSRINPRPVSDVAAAIANGQILANLIGRDEVMAGLDFAEASPISLPFDEAIQFFRQKLNLKSATWSQVYAQEHDHAFTVAGVMRDDMLADFRAAIDQAIVEGSTYEAFLADFDTIVARYGWSYNGTRGWRSRTIFDTNIRASYQAGRYAQMTNPDVLKYRPNWMYQHGDSRNPRPLHLGWNGIVLLADDPWWQSHYTPNGWGCKCRVVALSNRDLTRLGKTVGTAPDDGTFEWINPATGEVREIPRGIDPGWDYNPGKQWLNPATGRLEAR